MSAQLLLESGCAPLETEKEIIALINEVAGTTEKPSVQQPVTSDAVIPEGKRHDALLAVGRELRKAGVGRDGIIASLNGINVSCCGGAKSQKEIEGIADWCDKKIQGSGDKEELSIEELDRLVFIPTATNRPEQAKALITIKGHKILSTGNISVITALAGAGKSAVMESACASFFAIAEAESLGIKLHCKSFLYFDTERADQDHYASWERFLARAGQTPETLRADACTWVDTRSIPSVNDKKRYFFHLVDRDNAPEVVLLDGIGDLVREINNEGEANDFISALTSVANRRKIGIICTLHTNPRDKKARGVLGSELWRKCEASFLIEKVPASDTRKLTTEFEFGKVRSDCDKITQFFEWDTILCRHVGCDAPTPPQPKSIADATKILAALSGQRVWKRAEMAKIIMKTVEGRKKGEACSKRTAETRIGDLERTGCIVQDEDTKLFTIVKSEPSNDE
jgi:hypothetical protein